MPGVIEGLIRCVFGYQKKSDAGWHHFIKLPRMLRVISRVAVRVAVLIVVLVTFVPMDSLDRLLLPVTVLAM